MAEHNRQIQISGSRQHLSIGADGENSKHQDSRPDQFGEKIRSGTPYRWTG